MKRGWTRRQLAEPHPEHAGKLQQIASSAVSAQRRGCYTLYRLRHDDARGECIVALLGGVGCGNGPWEDKVVDMETGSVFVVSSEEEEWSAKHIRVTDLPEHILAHWPHHGDKPVRQGMRDSGDSDVDSAILRRIGQRVGASYGGPAQLALFG